MTATLRFVSFLATAAGQREISVDCPEDSTVATLLRGCLDRCRVENRRIFFSPAGDLKVTVLNHNVRQNAEDPVHPGDVLVVTPVMCGG